MSAVPPTSALPESVDENTVRRLCGEGRFAEADSLQRNGHVISPRLGEHGPEANVRGTWRRVDQVTIRIQSGRLLPFCSRDGEEFCRHTGALLLQCLRDPGSLAPANQAGDPTATNMRANARTGMPEPIDDTPADELAQLLEHDTATHLRQIARKRGVKLSGTKKAALVQQMTAALLDPTGIDNAIAGLDRADRIALETTYLLSAETPTFSDTLVDAMNVLGHSGDYQFDPLLDSGLMMLASRQVYGDEAYVVPRAVAARLPARGDIVQHAEIAAPESAPGNTSRLGMVETIQVIAQASLADHIKPRPRRHNIPDNAPPGFMFDPDEAGDVQSRSGPNAAGIHLVPLLILADDDLARLAERTGQSPATIDFVVRLMLGLQVAHIIPEVTIRFDRLQALLDMPDAERLATLTHAWLREASPSVLATLFGPDGALELRWNPTIMRWFPPIQPAIASIGHLVARVVSRMADDTLHDLASFVDLVDRLSPYASPHTGHIRTILTNARGITVTPTGATSKQKPGASEGWDLFLTAMVHAFLSGPLSWLGLVDVDTKSGRPHAFRVRPEAGVLADRFDANDSTRHPEPLVVGDDLTVLVPPGTTDIRIHGLLSRTGKLIDASANGLRYRLTPAGVQSVFDTGMTGPELMRHLTELAGGSMPETVRKELETWWQAFGTVRLYDELTVIELSDDLLLRELLATTELESAILQAFSPRLIAIDASREQEVITELSRRGHTPRVIGES